MKNKPTRVWYGKDFAEVRFSLIFWVFLFFVIKTALFGNFISFHPPEIDSVEMTVEQMYREYQEEWELPHEEESSEEYSVPFLGLLSLWWDSQD